MTCAHTPAGAGRPRAADGVDDARHDPRQAREPGGVEAALLGGAPGLGLDLGLGLGSHPNPNPNQGGILLEPAVELQPGEHDGLTPQLFLLQGNPDPNPNPDPDPNPNPSPHPHPHPQPDPHPSNPHPSPSPNPYPQSKPSP